MVELFFLSHRRPDVSNRFILIKNLIWREGTKNDYLFVKTLLENF